MNDELAEVLLLITGTISSSYCSHTYICLAPSCRRPSQPSSLSAGHAGPPEWWCNHGGGPTLNSQTPGGCKEMG